MLKFIIPGYVQVRNGEIARGIFWFLISMVTFPLCTLLALYLQPNLSLMILVIVSSFVLVFFIVRRNIKESLKISKSLNEKERAYGWLQLPFILLLGAIFNRVTLLETFSVHNMQGWTSLREGDCILVDKHLSWTSLRANDIILFKCSSIKYGICLRKVTGVSKANVQVSREMASVDADDLEPSVVSKDRILGRAIVIYFSNDLKRIGKSLLATSDSL